jgi:subtilisin family serine protease
MPSKKSWTLVRARRAALFLLFALGSSAGLAQDSAIVRPPNGPAYREGRILIIPRAGRAAALNQLNGQTGARLRRAFPDLGNIHVLELPQGMSARDAVTRYRQSGHVDAAALDIVFQASALPNDPRVIDGEQWHLNNVGQNGGAVDADIDAPEAWNILNSASNVVVAIVDSGARLTHQDLAGNLWVNPGEIPGNGLDDDHNGVIDDVHGINTVTDTGNPADDFWHGTHVAGIIGAVGNNGIGVSGVAWRVQLMPLKFLNQEGNGFLSDAMACLDYARIKGAKVINCSFTLPGALLSPNDYRMLSNVFWSVRNAGMVVVAAAGNNGTDNDTIPYYPAGFGRDGMDNVVAVGATTRSDFSVYNYGATSVHLAAPGYEIVSTFNASDSSYVSQSGTSMATPCVAGAVALVWAKFPALTYQQVITRLLGTVDPLPSLAGRCVTGGRLNLARALSGSFAIQPAPYLWVPTNGMASITLADDGVSTARPLPFTFHFGGRDYTNLYIGANGIIGLTNSSALTNTGNMDMPTSAAPNAIVCPLWDNLNPAAGGNVWFGIIGVAPYRSAAVSWVDVPHFVTAGGQTRFAFQALLHESGQIAFQYALVQNGNPNYVRGKSATIGVEDFMGAVAAKYSYNGEQTVTNNQTMVFVPDGSSPPVPTLIRLAGPEDGQLQLRVTAQIGQRCVVKASDDLSTWTNLATNLIPSSGTWDYSDTNALIHLHRFYQAVAVP